MRRAETARLIADLLRRGLAVRVRVTGRSMAPFLASGDTVELRAVLARELRRGDLVLTLPADGAVLLHRVVRLGRGAGPCRAVVTKGDATAAPDEPVGAERVVGRVVRVARTSRDASASFRSLDAPLARAVARTLAAAGAVAPSLLPRLATVPKRLTRIGRGRRSRPQSAPQP